MPADLLSDDLEREADELEKDDMALLNEILNAPSTGGDDFTREWQAVFGATPLSGTNANYTPVETDKPPESNEFMPSHLLDLSSHMGVMNLNQPGKLVQEAPFLTLLTSINPVSRYMYRKHPL